MITPPYLQPNDTIAIVATARKISSGEVSFAKQWLIDQGFKVVLGKTIDLEYHQFAGTDAQRAQDFQNAIDDPNIKAIWCARGGYGTIRMLDLLDFSNFKNQPKWIVGYSDVTVLHSHLHNLGVASIHAPMPIDIENASAEAKQSLIDALTLSDYKNSFLNQYKLKGGSVGGNLSMLYSMCGSKTALDTSGKILWIEDLDEYLYHIDRMLQNLDRNGMFANLKALVVGAMTQMNDNSIPFGFRVEEMILEITKKYPYPIYFNAPFGHIKDNRAVVMGR